MKNSILFLLIFSYFLLHKNELSKEKVDSMFNNKGFIPLSFKIVVILLLAFIFTFYILAFTQFENKSNFLFFLFITLSLFFIIINEKLLTNVNIESNKVKYSNIKDEITEGDLILCRSYHSYNIFELFIFRYLSCLLQNTFFGHIGVVVKDSDGTLKVIHSTYKENESGCMSSDLDEYIEKYYGNVYIYKNNLQNVNPKILDFNENKDFFDIYKDHKYGLKENEIACIGFAYEYMKYFDLFKNDPNKYFIGIDYFINKNNYKYGTEFTKPYLILNNYQRKNITTKI